MVADYHVILDVMKQLVIPNLEIKYRGGWCEKGVENAFGTDGIYSSAMVAWDHNSRHVSDLPVGFYVPIYLDLPNGPRDDNGKTEGDVAILCPDGSVAACAMDGENIGLYKYPSLQAYISDYTRANNGAIYKGWGEYVGNIKVIEEEDMLTPTQVDMVFKMGLKRPAREDEYNSNQYQNDAGFMIQTVWNNGGKANYDNPQTQTVETIVEVPVDKIVTVTKEVPVDFNQLTFGELISAAFKKLLNIK